MSSLGVFKPLLGEIIYKMPRRYFAVCCVITLASAAEPPKLRLGDDVQPRRYRLELAVIPEQDNFSGSIDIDLDIRRPTDLIWLNAVI